MRKSQLDALIPKTRQGVLAQVLLHPQGRIYLSEIARKLGVPPSSVQRELELLRKADILVRRRDGNRAYFEPNPACPFLPELRGLLVKTVGVVDVLREALAPCKAKIDCAFVFGSIARSQEHSQSDVDLAVIGSIRPFDLTEPLLEANLRLTREVNRVVFSQAEFRRKAQENPDLLT